jgi:hypothetical protein
MTTGFSVIVLVIAVALYFLPCIIAGCRDKVHGSLGIFLVNLFLGWTIAGWLLALVWASSGRTRREELLEEKRHRELLMVMGRK